MMTTSSAVKLLPSASITGSMSTGSKGRAWVEVSNHLYAWVV